MQHEPACWTAPDFRLRMMNSHDEQRLVLPTGTTGSPLDKCCGREGVACVDGHPQGDRLMLEVCDQRVMVRDEAVGVGSWASSWTQQAPVALGDRLGTAPADDALGAATSAPTPPKPPPLPLATLPPPRNQPPVPTIRGQDPRPRSTPPTPRTKNCLPSMPRRSRRSGMSTTGSPRTGTSKRSPSLI